MCGNACVDERGRRKKEEEVIFVFTLLGKLLCGVRLVF